MSRNLISIKIQMLSVVKEASIFTVNFVLVSYISSFAWVNHHAISYFGPKKSSRVLDEFSLIIIMLGLHAILQFRSCGTEYGVIIKQYA